MNRTATKLLALSAAGLAAAGLFAMAAAVPMSAHAPAMPGGAAARAVARPDDAATPQPSEMLDGDAAASQPDGALGPAAAPDVIVQSILITPAVPNPGQPFTISIVTRNQGDQATGNFWSHVYLDPPQAPPIASTPYTYRYNNLPIAAGGTFLLSRGQDPRFSFSTAGCNHAIYVWADPLNQVTESAEDNNIASIPVCVGVTCQADANEPNNACQAASWITNTAGIPQHNTLCAGDQDWFKFSTVAGITYTIEVTNVGAHASPLVSVVPACGGAAVGGDGRKVVWRAPSTGQAQVRVVNDLEPAGPLAGYDIVVTAEGSAAFDPFEPDDTCLLARDLPPDGTRQTHTFVAAGDVDWVRFPVNGGQATVLIADQPGPGVSPVITLYNSCAATFGVPVAGSAPTAQGQQVTYDSGAPAMLYAKVANQNPNGFGPAARYDLRLSVTSCAQDAYEPDGSPQAARVISTTGALQTRNTCPTGDQDWARFKAVSGTLYVIQTSNLGPDGDTDLFLYGPDGTTVLAHNDDYTVGLLNSRIVWRAPADGTYYAKVQHDRANVAGAGTRYDLAVFEGGCSPDAFDDGAGDNGPFDAPALSLGGAAQAHNFCPIGDADWVKFVVPAAGVSVTVQTSQLGPANDTVLTVYGPGGAVALAANDDYGPGGGSRVLFTTTVAGTYYARALHYDTNQFGTDVSYVISVTSGPLPPPPPPTPEPTPEPTPAPAQPSANAARTLILVNRERLGALFGDAEAGQVMARLYDLADDPRVVGLVAQVEQAPSVAAAYTAWTSSTAALLDTSKANAVAGAVRALALTHYDASPNLQYVLIVGDDRVIPFRRTKDWTAKPETHYSNTVTISTTQWAAFRDGMSLTDNFYADKVPSSWTNGELYLPDYGIGRLVETPAEIIGQIDAFLASNGLFVTNALVTGYDFVQDGADRVASVLSADSVPAVDGALIGPVWSGNALRQKQLEASPPFMIQSINGHGTHYAELTPDHADVSATLIASSTVNLAGAVIFSPACHAGFNDTGSLDLPQAFARKKASYIANTGYGWGGGGVTFSEALMRNYALRLFKDGSAQVGPALAQAKSRYYQQASIFGVYDEKVLVESTLYGLPMAAITTGATLADDLPFPSMGATSTLPAGSFGEVKVGRFQAALAGSFGAYDPVTDTQGYFGEGAFYALDDSVHVAAGEPVQPKFYANLTVTPAGTLRGVLFLGGAYTDVAGFDPVIAQPFNEYVTPTAEPAFDAPGWYPPVPFSVVSTGPQSQTVDTLVTVMGQFDSGTDTERLYSALSFDTYYSSDSDTQPPAVEAIAAVLNQAARKGAVKVEVSDGSGVARVLVSFTEGDGVWRSKDLAYDSSTFKWRGEITATLNTLFFVQAVDLAGNVETAHNKGAYYRMLPPAPLVPGRTPKRVLVPIVRR